MARVLVVDDVRFILQMIASIFRDQGHDVLTADNGEAAIETALTERPDLILLDIAMPGMDGVDVARQLRAEACMSATRILMVTSQSDSRSIARATEAGADDYVCKPFDTPTLLAKAANLLGSYRMNLSLEDMGGVSVLTVLGSVLDDGVGADVDAALDEARSRPVPLVLDIGRVTKVDPPAADLVLRHAREHHDAGLELHLVRPARGVGTRTLAVRLGPYVTLHEDRTTALVAAGARREERKARERAETPDVAPVPEAPEAGALEPAASRAPSSPVVVDAIGNVAIVRVRSRSLTEAFSAIREEILPRSQRNILLTLKNVGEVSAEDVGALDAFAQELQRTGRCLKLVDPRDSVADALREGGLGRLVVESGEKKGEPTRASS